MTTWNKTNNRFSKFSDVYGSAKSSASTVKGLVGGSKSKARRTTSGSTSGTGPTGTQAQSSSDSKKKYATSNNAIYLDFKLYIEG